MPLTVTIEDKTTVLAFSERCTAEEAIETKVVLSNALAQYPILRFETKTAESICTPCLQLAVSAIASCDTFESSEDIFFKNALARWGLSLSDIEKQKNNQTNNA